MRDKVALQDGSALAADPLQDKRFEAILAVLNAFCGFRWTWGEDEVQRLIAAGWEINGEGELRYTFNSAEGDECSVNVFAAAYERLTDKFGTAVRLVPGRGRSATWIQTDVLMVLTPHQFKLVKPVSGRWHRRGRVARQARSAACDALDLGGRGCP